MQKRQGNKAEKAGISACTLGSATVVLTAVLTCLCRLHCSKIEMLTQVGEFIS